MHPQAVEYLQWVASLNEPSFATGATPAQIRAARRLRPPLPKEDVHRVEDMNAHGVPVRVYWPVKSDAPLPALIFYHGGGWVLGDLDAYDPTCRTLANASACVVISVDYRLAPEHPFPAAVDDSVTAAKWVHQHAATLHIRAGALPHSASASSRALANAKSAQTASRWAATLRAATSPRWWRSCGRSPSPSRCSCTPGATCACSRAR